MLGIEEEIESADPPPNPKPDAPPAIHLPEPDRQAEGEPEDEHNEGGLEQHSLRLGEPLDVLQGEHRGEKGRLRRDPRAHLPVPAAPRDLEEDAAPVHHVVPRLAGAQRPVVAQRLRWARRRTRIHLSRFLAS